MKYKKLERLSLSVTSQIVVGGIFLGAASACYAQGAESGGSPLDTLMQTKLWADVPEAKDFVRDSRPPPDSLAYQPVTRTDLERPRLKTKDELKALEAELDRAAKHNHRSAGKSSAKPRAAKSAKSNHASAAPLERSAGH